MNARTALILTAAAALITTAGAVGVSNLYEVKCDIAANAMNFFVPNVCKMVETTFNQLTTLRVVPLVTKVSITVVFVAMLVSIYRDVIFNQKLMQAMIIILRSLVAIGLIHSTPNIQAIGWNAFISMYQAAEQTSNNRLKQDISSAGAVFNSTVMAVTNVVAGAQAAKVVAKGALKQGIKAVNARQARAIDSEQLAKEMGVKLPTVGSVTAQQALKVRTAYMKADQAFRARLDNMNAFYADDALGGSHNMLTTWKPDPKKMAQQIKLYTEKYGAAGKQMVIKAAADAKAATIRSYDAFKAQELSAMQMQAYLDSLKPIAQGVSANGKVVTKQMRESAQAMLNAMPKGVLPGGAAGAALSVGAVMGGDAGTDLNEDGTTPPMEKMGLTYALVLPFMGGYAYIIYAFVFSVILVLTLFPIFPAWMVLTNSSRPLLASMVTAFSLTIGVIFVPFAFNVAVNIGFLQPQKQMNVIFTRMKDQMSDDGAAADKLSKYYAQMTNFDMGSGAGWLQSINGLKGVVSGIGDLFRGGDVMNYVTGMVNRTIQGLVLMIIGVAIGLSMMIGIPYFAVTLIGAQIPGGGTVMRHKN